jgi:hypothetical protein
MAKTRHLKSTYEAPQATFRGIFLLEGIAGTVQSPVRKAELEAWEEVEPVAEKDEEGLSFQVW